ncbi:MAG: Asp-tRNA(Asn)/Glu-tRNA(Gln) amidotransferase subunit GatA [Calditrichaceae bacterium]
MTLNEKVAAIKNGQIKAVDKLEKYLEQSQKNKELNAFINILEDGARKRAETIDQNIQNGIDPGPLTGVVMAIKDNINIKNEKTTCGSKILQPFKSPYNATVINKLEKAGAIFIGKTNMDEYAMGSSNENSSFGPVRNPVDKTRVPGGSSGGSAVSVAAGMADAALGSETGGSIRQPASFTGVVGLKPSYGRVSRYGLVAFASSLDQIGVFAPTVSDNALVFGQIAGHDMNDSTSADVAVPDYSEYLGRDVKGVRIGIPDEYFGDGLDENIRDGVLGMVDRLREQGAEVKKIKMPTSQYGISVYYIIATAEASSNLARYDGVRYGLSIRESGDDLIDMYSKTRSQGFGDEVRRRIMLGTYVLSSGYYDAYYKKAQKARRLIKNELDEAFKNLDVIVTPTTPTTAFGLGEKIDDPLAMYLSDIYTVSANLAGICAMSVPVGKHPNGLPFGIQLLSNAFNEGMLFRVGDYIEKIVEKQ